MTKKPFLILFFLLILGQGLSLAAALPVDSIGVETRNGKTFVVHKVVPKETLFALSRKYHVAVDKIVDANPKIQSGLQVGQLVYIPRNTPAAAAPASPHPGIPACLRYPVRKSPCRSHPLPPRGGSSSFRTASAFRP